MLDTSGVDNVVSPRVAFVVLGQINSGALHHQNMLDGAGCAVCARRQGFVGGVLERHWFVAPELPVADDQQFRVSIGDPGS